MRTTAVDAPEPRYAPTLTLDPWNVPPGDSRDWLPDDHFIYYDENMMVRGDPEWPPSIITYHGHPVPLPKVSIKYVGRGAKYLKLLVTFLAKEWNDELRLLSWKPIFTVPAWQGDNNIIHLMEALPGETDKALDMAEFEETAEEIDADYLTRIRMVLPDEEITHLAPELFFVPDDAKPTRA